MGQCGSRSCTARSGGSRRRAGSLSIRSRRRRAFRTTSPSGLTARCGLPRAAATRSGGSPPSGAITRVRGLTRSSTLGHHRRAGRRAVVHRVVSATRSGGSPPPGAITEYTVPTARQPTCRNHSRAGRRAVVYRVAAAQDRADHHRRRHHRVPGADCRSGPSGITAGAGRSAVVHRDHGNKIGRITTSGQVSEYSVPSAEAAPDSITAGPDGALWFTSRHDQIGRVTPHGTFSHYPVGNLPAEITAGPNHTVWVTLRGTSAQNGDAVEWLATPRLTLSPRPIVHLP